MILTAREVEKFLRQFEPLQSVAVEEVSVLAPWLVKLHGVIPIEGELHAYEADLNLMEFGGAQDLMKLAGQLLKSFEAASNNKGKE